jgi:diguanylate cyclase (GGDEF)-like protein
MQLYPTALLKLILPAVLLVAAYLARTRFGNLGEDTWVIVANLPYLVCIVASCMAAVFNRSRLLLGSLGVFAFYWVVRDTLQVSLDDPDALRAYLALSLGVPLTGFYLLLLPERGIRSLHGAGYVAGFVFLLLVAMWLGPWLAGLSEAAAHYYMPRPVDGYVLSRGATVFSMFVFMVGVGLMCVRDEEAEPALLGALVALCVALALLHVQYISVAMGTAAGLCLMWGIMRSSHAMAYRDELTGLPGRRALNERLRLPIGRYVVAMIDVDHFKKFNDTHGHDVGDDVLRLVASRLRRVGGGGRAYRYGGEEFCIVFARRDLEDCAGFVDEVREQIAEYRMSLRNNTLRPVRSRQGAKRRGATRVNTSQVSVTVSAGLAERSEATPDAESVIAAADKKLYRAKRAGRNRVAY